MLSLEQMDMLIIIITHITDITIKFHDYDYVLYVPLTFTDILLPQVECEVELTGDVNQTVCQGLVQGSVSSCHVIQGSTDI